MVQEKFCTLWDSQSNWFLKVGYYRTANQKVGNITMVFQGIISYGCIF